MLHDFQMTHYEEIIFVSVFFGMVFICYCFAIHLIVTWNPHHRPVIPLVVALMLSVGTIFALSIEGDGNYSSGEFLELLFFVIFVEAGILVLWLPLVFALVTIQMIRVTFWKRSEDPLMDMLDN